MDPWKTDDFSQPLNSNPVPTSSVHPTLHPLHNSHPEPRQRPDVEVKDPISSRKVQKADREKLRRDRLNEHFLELGNALDPDRPKNDKATILTDTIQVLKDLTAEVNRLKVECAALSEESRELTQEKNELREEKASLKSDIDNLNLQYQQRLGVMFPWTTAIDPSVVMAPPYSYPVPLPMHPPALQPFPFFGNQNPGAIPIPCSTFIPYPNPANQHIHMDRPSYECASTSRISSNQDSRSKTTSGHCRDSNDNKSDDSNDVVTDLELKTPGSTVQQVGFKSIESDDTRQRRYCSLRYAGTEQLPPGEERKGKQSQWKERSIVDESSSSRRSSSQGFQDSSSNGMGHPKVQ